MNNSNGSENSYQHTIANTISISGVGIHSGQSVNITIEPAEPNTGIIFQRIDIEGQPTVKADVDFCN